MSLRQRWEPHPTLPDALIVGVGCDHPNCPALHEAVNGPRNGVQARREAEALGWMTGGFSGSDYCPQHPPTPADLALTPQGDTDA